MMLDKSLKLDQNEKEMLEHIICQMEEERGMDQCCGNRRICALLLFSRFARQRSSSRMKVRSTHRSREDRQRF